MEETTQTTTNTQKIAIDSIIYLQSRIKIYRFTKVRTKMLSYAPKSVCGLVYLKSPKKNDIIYIKMCVRVFVCHLFLFSQRRVDISSIHRKCKRVKTFCEWNLILIVLVLWKWYRCFLFR